MTFDDRLLGAEFTFRESGVVWRVQVSAVTGWTPSDEVTVYVCRESRKGGAGAGAGAGAWGSGLSLQRMPLGLLAKGIAAGRLVPVGPPERRVPTLVNLLGKALGLPTVQDWAVVKELKKTRKRKGGQWR